MGLAKMAGRLTSVASPSKKLDLSWVPDGHQLPLTMCVVPTEASNQQPSTLISCVQPECVVPIVAPIEKEPSDNEQESSDNSSEDDPDAPPPAKPRQRKKSKKTQDEIPTEQQVEAPPGQVEAAPEQVTMPTRD